MVMMTMIAMTIMLTTAVITLTESGT